MNSKYIEVHTPPCCASVSAEWSADWPAAVQSLTVLYEDKEQSFTLLHWAAIASFF